MQSAAGSMMVSWRSVTHVRVTGHELVGHRLLPTTGGRLHPSPTDKGAQACTATCVGSTVLGLQPFFMGLQQAPTTAVLP